MTPFNPTLWLAGLVAMLCSGTIRAEDPAAAATPPDVGLLLTEFEARSPKGYEPPLIAENNMRVITLVESNQLATGSDYYRAAALLGRDLGEYRVGRIAYELALAALAKNDTNAEHLLPMTWDLLLNKLGRPLRIDASNMVAGNPDFLDADPAPACIRAVWSNPAAARASLVAARDNPEIKNLVDADQSDRKVNFSTQTADERNALIARDRQRNVRIREIVTAEDVHTAADFARAGLVMQHSPKPAGIQLAHELAVCAMLLGDRAEGRWLVAASYDRFLRQLGHDQRFGTQFGALGLNRVDEAGICDAERLALGCRTLAASRKLQPKL